MRPILRARRLSWKSQILYNGQRYRITIESTRTGWIAWLCRTTAKDLLREIRDGAQVAEALFMSLGERQQFAYQSQPEA